MSTFDPTIFINKAMASLPTLLKCQLMYITTTSYSFLLEIKYKTTIYLFIACHHCRNMELYECIVKCAGK